MKGFRKIIRQRPGYDVMLLKKDERIAGYYSRTGTYTQNDWPKTANYEKKST